MSLKYQGCAVVFQEVPDEITLAFNIAGCPWHCEGCHSPNLWNDVGMSLIDNYAREIENHPGISCVCFMGGDWDLDEIITLGKWIRTHYDLKTCLYMGPAYADMHTMLSDMYGAFDYIKTGWYMQGKGPLSSPTTNQRFYKINEDRTVEDLTWRFQKKYE